MKKRILCTLLILCLVVGMCPIFASAAGSECFLKDLDGKVHVLNYLMSKSGDGWSWDCETGTLMLNGFTGIFFSGWWGCEKIVLVDGSTNRLDSLNAVIDKELTIEGNGELICNNTKSTEDSSEAVLFGFGSESCFFLADNLSMTGGEKEGDTYPLALVECPSSDDSNVYRCAMTANGTPAKYVRFGPKDSTPPTPDKPTVGGFTDVYEDDYYAAPVVWAVENGITSGAGDNSFNPGGPCTRAQIVTFLWRAAGKPAPTGSAAFPDVPAGEYYADAVKWAVEKGITSGSGDGKFSPNDPCTRAQAVTFLWRAAGKPAATGTGFADVEKGSYYEEAVKWAVGKGVTSGTGDGFSPAGSCSRGQIVTFLYRAK